MQQYYLDLIEIVFLDFASDSEGGDGDVEAGEEELRTTKKET